MVVAGLALATVGADVLPKAPPPSGGTAASARAVRFVPDSNPNRLRQWINEKRRGLVWEADGIESSIGILGQDGLAFVVNGKTDGNSLEDAATQIGAAILGAVLHDDPKTGARDRPGHRRIGRLARADAQHASTSTSWSWNRRSTRWRAAAASSIGTCSTTTACGGSTTTAASLSSRPKNQQYDLIISEPSNPYRAGVASLYTSEFYQAVRRRLKPGGIFIQWLQAYEVDALTVHTVVATARSAFEHVEAWQTLGRGSATGLLGRVRSSIPPRSCASGLRPKWCRRR